MKKSWMWSSLILPLLGFRLPVPTDDGDRKLLSDISQYGWHVIHIPEDDVGPGYSFTVGLYYSYKHPELAIMGLSQSTSHGIFNAAVKVISEGSSFHHADVTDALTQANNCKFSKINKNSYEEYLGSIIWFYRNINHRFPALQILWPDKAGKFPDEEGFDPKLKRLQIKI